MSAVRETTQKTGKQTLICHCYQVTEPEIRSTIDEHALESVEEVTLHTSAGGGCTACHCRIKRLLAGLPARCGPMQMCDGCGCGTLQCACEV